MKKVIYLTKEELVDAVSHVTAHIGDDCEVKPSSFMIMGFMIFGVELIHYLEDNFTVNEPGNESEKLDFPNSN